MAQKRTKSKRSVSVLWKLVNKISIMIYSFFVNGRVGDMLSSQDTLCKNSFLSKMFERKKGRVADAVIRYPEMMLSQSTFLRAVRAFGRFWASLGLNVYGVFFTFYGLSACIAHIIPALMDGYASFDETSVVLSVMISLCSLPMLFSSQSAIEAISTSRIVSRIVLEILCVPKEHLRSKKRYSGTVYVFSAAVISMLLGAVSVYMHPLLVPALLFYIVMVFAIFSFPEIGVITTFALLPFLQYFPNPDGALLMMILLTGISYLFKVFQRKRTFSLSAEIDMVLLFCGFMLVSGSFSYGGAETFWDSVSSVVIILGGFLLTYNLLNTDKLLYACMKTLTASFLVLCLVGIWESGYYGISARIIDSVSPDMSTLAGGNMFYISDNGAVFGMFAIFVFPLLFAYITKRKSVQGACAVTVLCILLTVASWMCSCYEVMIALMLECVVFWALYSYKTLSVVIIALIPIGIVSMLYPYAVSYFGWQDISELLMEYMPAGMTDSNIHLSVTGDVIKMISDGNLFGIGACDSAFGVIFPSYAGEASVGAKDPMSFWLQLLCWSGIFGFISFAVFLIFLFKRSLGFFITCEKGELRSKALGLFCGILAALLIGQVYSMWSDVRIMYLFWAVSGLLAGHIRLGQAKRNDHISSFEHTASAADAEVSFYD